MVDALTQGTRIGDRYALRKVIGQGGFGVVARARDERLGRDVAIKLPSADALLGAESQQRFLREARVCAQLKSEFSNRVYDAFIDPTYGPCLVMEFLRGQDLGARARDYGPVSLAVGCDYALQACVALAEAHALGVVHRDVKPQNLFLVDDAGEERIKVLDFGIAGLLADEEFLTRSTSMMGTPRYMAPEHMRGTKFVDRRADLWSLGVVLYELITGSPVRDVKGDFRFPMAVAAAGIVPIRVRLPDAPEALDAFFARALAVPVEERFQDAGELAAGLAVFASPRMSELAARAEAISQSMPALTPPRAP